MTEDAFRERARIGGIIIERLPEVADEILQLIEEIEVCCSCHYFCLGFVLTIYRLNRILENVKPQ